MAWLSPSTSRSSLNPGPEPNFPSPEAKVNIAWRRFGPIECHVLERHLRRAIDPPCRSRVSPEPLGENTSGIVLAPAAKPNEFAVVGHVRSARAVTVEDVADKRGDAGHGRVVFGIDWNAAHVRVPTWRRDADQIRNAVLTRLIVRDERSREPAVVRPSRDLAREEVGHALVDVVQRDGLAIPCLCRLSPRRCGRPRRGSTPRAGYRTCSARTRAT